MKIHLKHLVLILVVICQESYSAAIQENTREINTTLSLPIPELNYTIIEDPPKVIIRWDPVKSSEDNPIFGYKIKLWEEEKNEEIDDFGDYESNLQLVKKMQQISTIQKPKVEAVLPPEILETEFNLTKGLHYEIKAQTFNAYGDGPLSSAQKFDMLDDEFKYPAESTYRIPNTNRTITIKILSSNIEDYIENLKEQNKASSE